LCLFRLLRPRAGAGFTTARRQVPSIVDALGPVLDARAILYEAVTVNTNAEGVIDSACPVVCPAIGDGGGGAVAVSELAARPAGTANPVLKIWDGTWCWLRETGVARADANTCFADPQEIKVVKKDPIAA
jgi:hypothetical protein